MRIRALALLAALLPITAVVPVATALPSQEPAASAGTLTVDIAVVIAAPREAVYGQLLQIGEWWDPEHTFFGAAAQLTLEPRPGGCFCESHPDGRGVEHMRVLGVSPGVWIRLGGGLGPLQEHPVNGVMTLSLEDADAGTRVRLLYRVAGHIDYGMEAWTDPVTVVLQQQLDRLKRLIETGSPDA